MMMGKTAYVGLVVAVLAAVSVHLWLVYVESDLADWREIAVMGLQMKVKVTMVGAMSIAVLKTNCYFVYMLVISPGYNPGARCGA